MIELSLGRTTLLSLANDANHVASQVGAVPCLALLLERGADPAQRDRFGQTALHSFAYGKDLEALDRLLEAGADADLVDDRGRTPLMASRSTSIAQRLLAAGARRDRRDRYGYDALDHAIIYGRDEVAALLEGPGRIARPEARLVRAVRDHDVNTINALLAAGVPADTVGTDGSPVLITAASTLVVEALRALSDKGAPVDGRDAEGSTALDGCLWSFRGGWEENQACTMLLLDRGASLDARPDVPGRRGDAAIFKGLSWWRIEPVAARVLSANQGARSHAGETSLMMAVKSGSAAQVALLLRMKIGVGEVDRSGLTALHYAADGPGREDQGEYAEKAELLIDAGAEIDAVDGSGETPLFKAVRSGHERTFELLLERGADTARRNAKGESIAAVALQTPHVWLFNRLLRLPSDQAR